MSNFGAPTTLPWCAMLPVKWARQDAWRAVAVCLGFDVKMGENWGGGTSRKRRGHMSDHYLEVISLIERLHRQFLGLVKLELDSLRIHDVNNVQAMLLFNMGEDEISVGELISRGYYLGSNVSYNVKKLAESGYLTYERSMHDRRSIRVRLTRQGSILRDRLSGMLNRQIETLGQTQITDTDLESAVTTLARLERYWIRPNVSR